MNYKKVSNSDFVVKLDRGEEIVSTLTRFFCDREISSGTVSGIGALSCVELGFYDTSCKEYKRKTFESDLEILNCNGNISLKNGNPFAHMHILLSRSDFNVVGGHLFSGTISVTGEFHIRVFNERIERKEGAGGLALWEI